MANLTASLNKGSVSRRDFLKYAAGGLAVIVVGSKLKWLDGGFAQAANPVSSVVFRIQDAIKGMVTDNAGFASTAPNVAKCYFWIYKSVAEGTPATGIDLPAEVPGPAMVALKGDTIHIKVYNDLDENHAFYIPGIVNSGAIAPNTFWEADVDLTNAPCGAHLYYDNLNAPVNRVMGLHGPLIVMATEADRTAGHKLTPYGGLAADHGVQRLYDSFGNNGTMPTVFPGLAWEEGDATPWSMNLGPNGRTEPGFMPMTAPGLNRPNCPPFRQYVWLDHQASPRLFKEVGNLGAGVTYDPVEFMDKFLRHNRDPIHINNQANIVGEDNISYLPQYFTINGQPGMLSHFNPHVTPIGRVGEPVVIHILNAGLWAHSMHLHANHMWITSVSMVDGPLNPNPNPIWVDVYRVDPMTRIDYTVPFMRPPDVGHPKGIGLPETPLQAIANPRINGSTPHPVWPPIEEFNVYMPSLGTKAKDINGNDVELGQRQSPLCYPMHDHSEPSQTAQGGNYNNGLISGIYFTGDRQGTMDFPMDEDFWMANQNIRGVDPTPGYTGSCAPQMGEGL